MSVDLRTTSSVRSWGRVTRALHEVVRPTYRDELGPSVAAAAQRGPLLAVGLGRSYGDSGLNPGGPVIAMDGLDRVLSFDTASGVLRADAGLSLDALIRLALPHGFFPPVVPGTKFVTLGGAVANDIHGKNHHRVGTFGRHVRRLRLRRSDGSVQELGPHDETGLFAATVGGLGLTGLIEWVELELKPLAGAYFDAEDVMFGGLDEFFALAEESEITHEHTVAWIDCTQGGRKLGRGVFTRANSALDDDRRLHAARPRRSMPVEAPDFALNPVTLKAFNLAYHTLKKSRAGRSRVHYDPLFFPLDSIANWNRLYGAGGMYQYQCVVPSPAAADSIRELVRQIARSGAGSFLAVLKTFGGLESPGMLSFPVRGTTLALDFRNQGDVTLALFERLDSVVREAGGRLYPAKDGRLPRSMLAAGYPNLERFRQHVDFGFSSGFWRRVNP